MPNLDSGDSLAHPSILSSGDELRLVIDTIPAPAWVVRPDGKLELINRHWLDYSGLSLQEALVDPTSTVHPDDLPKVMEKWRDHMDTGESYEDEMRLRRADGEYRWFLVRTVPLLDERGKVVRWYGTSTDIEDRKRAEEELRRSQQLLNLVLETLPVGVMVADRVGNLMLFNAASRRIWGQRMIQSGVERWACSPGYWHDSGQRILPTQWPSVRALRDGKTTLNELIDIDAFDGSRKTIQASAAPIRAADGSIVGAVIVMEEVTERVRAEGAVRESATRLQQLSRCLITLQEEERSHLSRELHDEFGQLLAATALHLRAAKNVAGEAAQSGLDESMSLLHRAGEQIRNLALELRPIMLETGGLDATVKWLVQQFERRSGIATEVVGRVGDVSGDLATACFRVIQEALTNILRHAQAHRVRIELSRREDLLELTIQDDGVGFDVAKAMDQPANIGHLGLLGMKERVEILGGTLQIESQLRQGTRIRVVLPEHSGAPALRAV